MAQATTVSKIFEKVLLKHSTETRYGVQMYQL